MSCSVALFTFLLQGRIQCFFSLSSLFDFSFGHTLCDAIAAHTHVCLQWHFALLLQTASKIGHIEFFCEVSFVLFPSDCS